MKTVGLITEYNPFHMGHKYHIQKAKELTGAETAVVIMSGNYVQRGTPAFMDKHARTKIALNHGADIVLELPVPFSCVSAELFALSAITLLNKTGIVDYICFGCEFDDLEILDNIALILAEAKKDSSHQLNNLIRDYVKCGENYATARSLALCKYLKTYYPNTEMNISIIKDVLNQPNNILAIEYLKALKLINSPMKPVPLKRTSASYHDNEENDFMYSASSVRNIVNSTISADYKEHIQRLSLFDNTYNDAFGKLYPIYESDFNIIIGEKLISCKLNNIDINKFAGIDISLANRIYNTLESCPFTDWSTFIEALKTKNIAYTAVSRALLSIALGVEKKQIEQYLANDIASYVRILGFRKDASELLKCIKENGKLTLIGQLSEIKDNSYLNEIDRCMLTQSIYCDELYNMVVRTKFKSNVPNEYQRKLVII